MNPLHELASSHPWLLAAAIAAPLVIAAWAAIGSHFLESRYGSEVFGPAEHS
ncbi:MAG: hypothetical protein ACTHNU_17725 [Gaiellales bacterium]